MQWAAGWRRWGGSATPSREEVLAKGAFDTDTGKTPWGARPQRFGIPCRQAQDRSRGPPVPWEAECPKWWAFSIYLQPRRSQVATFLRNTGSCLPWAPSWSPRIHLLGIGIRCRGRVAGGWQNRHGELRHVTGQCLEKRHDLIQFLL